MVTVTIDDKNGTLWDISTMVTDVTWKTSRVGKAGSLELTFVKESPFQDREFSYNNGDIVAIRKGAKNLFYGYIFSIDRSKDDTVRLTAYDQVRYLMANESYMFRNRTATDVIATIARDFELQVGSLADTVHRIPSMVEDNKKLLDMITRALDLTLIATGNIFVFYDDFGALTLRNAVNMTVDRAVGEGSQLTNYSHTTSIDSETYNRIKLVHENKQSGRKDVYIAQDSVRISQWGRLQLYQVANEDLNQAQFKERAAQLLKYRNRESKTLQVDSLGDPDVRAGSYVHIRIDALEIEQRMLVQECSHEFKGKEHIMKLDLKVI